MVHGMLVAEDLGRHAPTRAAATTGAQVQALLWKLDVLLPCLPPPPLEELLDDVEAMTLKAEANGKHVLQEASIIAHLDRIGALSDRSISVAIELGAGTAKLSDRLQRVTRARLLHVLVDRRDDFKPFRDRSMRSRASASGVPDEAAEGAARRVVADIATFDFDDYRPPATAEAAGGECCQLCVSKHLCGPACDLAIAALGRAAAERRPPCCFATCCHYLCGWESFCGREFWCALGLDADDFRVAVATSQWASMREDEAPRNRGAARGSHGAPARGAVPCEDSPLFVRWVQARTIGGAASTDSYGDGPRWLPDLSEVARAAAARLREAEAEAPCPVERRAFERTFSRSAKISLGRRAKLLLDYARAAALQQGLGYRVRLVRYTTRSLEDRLLVAAPARKNYR